MSKSSVSTGCIVASLIGGFFLLGAVVLVGLFALGYFTLQRSAPSSRAPLSAPEPTATGGPSSAGVDRPEPTPEQVRAIAGGTTVEWAEHGLSWTVPAGWSKQQEAPEFFSVKSPGSFDAGWLTASVSPPMPEAFPAETSLQAMYTQALDQQRIGRYTDVRMLELDGVRGVQFTEAPPATPSDVQRIEWQGYVSRGGRAVLITLMTHSSGKGFPTHRDALYGVLYSTKVSK
jgi:hypothetical protein